MTQILISASAAFGLFAGTLHLHDTFFSPVFRPQDPEIEARIEARIKEVSPNFTSQTTMWKAMLVRKFQ